MNAAVDMAPALRLLALAAALALPPLGWLAWKKRRHGPAALTAALTAMTLFLTFDLIVVGAFTRLSDSGLGCPDWPGCYGRATPLGAADDIAAAESAAPSGKVTWKKAWIEMAHRYMAMAVGALIVAATVLAWRRRRQLALSPWWPTATLAWVLLQGLFGKYTVTLKLYPAVVTAHLLGGLVLLVLLAVQHARLSSTAVALYKPLRRLAWVAAAALTLQIVLGGWVSTNYAVLACSGFPQCNGSWWPAMDAAGFAPLRTLGHAADGSGLGFEAMVGIHFAHRAFALVAAAALALLAWRLWKGGGSAAARRFGVALAGLLLLQLVSGLSNVVLGWPLLAALLHSAGAAALTLSLALLLARSSSSHAGSPA